MSCSAARSPLLSSGADFEDVTLPKEYYFMTAAMVALVIGIPFVYRQIWLLVFDLVHYLRQKPEHRGGPPGLRRYGKPGDRNLSKAFSRKTQSNGSAEGKPQWRVEALFDYPIKSTYPVEVEESLVMLSGLQHDRQFCFAQWKEPLPAAGKEINPKPAPKKGSSEYWKTVPHWDFLTQRAFPRLTLVRTEIWVPDKSSPSFDNEDEYVESQGCLVVKFPFTPVVESLCIEHVKNLWTILITKIKARSWSAEPIWTFNVPFNPTTEQIKAKGYGFDKIRIWRDEPAALDVTSEISRDMLEKLKYTLGVSNDLRLFRVDVAKDRHLYKCAPTEKQLGYQAMVGFQDSYPIHLQNVNSIAKMENDVPRDGPFKPDSRRYRGNIYISGPPGFDEEDWTLIRIGNHKFHVSCRTTRCQLPTNDPDTGIPDVRKRQPYVHMIKNRSIDDGAPNSGCLGMHLVPTKDAIRGVIKVGDEVEVLKTGKHFFVADPEPEAQRPVL